MSTQPDHTQPDLIDRLPGPRPPAVDPADIDRLKAQLAGQGWQSCATISQATGWTDRKIRALANAAAGAVISGQRGYRLTSEATPAEIRHAWTWLASQGDAMRLRAHQIRTQAHQQIS